MDHCGTGQLIVGAGQVLLGSAVVAPAAGALAAASLRGRRQLCAKVATAASWVSMACAGVLLVVVAARGAVGLELGSAGTRTAAGLWANQLTVSLLVLVCGIGAIVLSFSCRYLRADLRAPRFFVGAGVLISSMALVATSSTATGLVIGWVAAGLAFVAIVGYRPDLPGVIPSARRTRRLFLIGDGALIIAVVLVTARVGTTDLVTPHVLVAGAHRMGDLRAPVALLVVVAAITRCALGPLGGWLPGTIAAPTPVSALLHAGFVNGGGILLIRMGALSADSTGAMAIAFAVAVLTAIGATAVMAYRADVKGDLAFSTMGQMGFMVAECAVGAYGAAAVHLVGHAIYKATLFLGSGTGVERPGRVAPGRDGGWTWPRMAVAGFSGVAAAATVAAVPGVLGHRGGAPLLVFIGATAGVGAWSWWSIGRTTALVGWLVATVAASTIYGLLAGGLAAWLQPSLPSVGNGVLDPWLLLLVAAGGVATALATRLPSLGPWVRILLVSAGSPGKRATVRAVSGHSSIGVRPVALADVATARSAA